MVYKFCENDTWKNFLQNFYQHLITLNSDFSQFISLSTDGETLNIFMPFDLIISFSWDKGLRYLRKDSTSSEYIESLDHQNRIYVTSLFKIGNFSAPSAGLYRSWCGVSTSYGAGLSPIYTFLDDGKFYDITPADCCFYFTTIKNFYTEEDSPAFFFPYATTWRNDRTSIRDFESNDFFNCVFSLAHPNIEFINSQFFNSQKESNAKNQARISLLPFFCKDVPCYAPHLYLKIINNPIAYGDLQIQNKTFFAGSFYAIET